MFSYRLKYNAASVTCYPRIADGLQFEENKTSDGVLLEKILVNELKFVGSDFSNITAQAYGTKFTFEIYSNDALYHSSIFYKQDCRINYDEACLYVKTKNNSIYDKIEEIKGVEIRLNELNIKKNTFYYKKYPLIQYYLTDYTQGDNKVMNYIMGNVFYQDCEPRTFLDVIYNPDDADLWASTVDNYLFFSGNLDISGIWRLSSDNIYRHITQPYSINVYNYSQTEKRCEIFNINTNALLYTSNAVLSSECNFSGNYKMTLFTFYKVGNGSITSQVLDQKMLISRILIGDGYNSQMLPNEPKYTNAQKFAANEQYNSIVNIPEIKDYFTAYANTQKTITETKYNISADGKYFVEKTSDNQYKYFPVGESSWGYFSVWVRGSNSLNEFQYTNSVEMKNIAFNIFNIIDAIFQKYNINLYSISSFFSNAVNPITEELKSYPLITDVTNLTGQYPSFNKPATATKVSLQQLFELLNRMHNITYCVYGNQLRFEHIYFFENGESYGIAPNVGIDLTLKEYTRGNYTMADLIDEITYNVTDEYKYINFSTQDSSSHFSDSHIVNNITHTEAANNIDIQAYTDITEITVISQDGSFSGLFYMLCEVSNNKFQLPVKKAIAFKNNVLNIPNIFASIAYNARYLYNYNYYNASILVDDLSVTTKGYFRGKIQQVTALLSQFNVDAKKLIKTNLGIGFIRKNTIYLDSNYCKLEVSHDID